jgi:glycosyltransferase involved in cell wall biosynthesis
MKIKVLESIRQGLIGGGETHLISLVENLDKNLFEPIVLSFTDGPMVNRFREMNITTHVIPTLHPFDFRIWPNVLSFAKYEGIDLIHAHGTRAASNTFQAARSLNIPLVYTIHGWSFHNDQPFWKKKMRIWSEKFLTSRADANISVSSSNRETGRTNLGSFNSNVILNGIELDRFDPDKTYPDIRKELGIPNDVKLVIFLARFTRHKQPQKVVEGFYQALKRQPDMVLLMVGEGDAKKETIDLVVKLNIQHKVYFEPFRSDVSALLNAADIFVLASLWEGLPMSILEAMAMRKAIIASKVDGNAEVITHMKNGWLVDIEKIEKNLADAFIALSRDDSLRKKLGNCARETVESEYDAAKMTLATESVYFKLVESKHKIGKKLSFNNGI